MKLPTADKEILHQLATICGSDTEAQLTWLLYRYGFPTILTAQVIACVMLSALRGYAPPAGLVWWGASFTLITLLRAGIYLFWRLSGRQRERHLFFTRLYGAGALAAGIAWAALLLFYDAALPVYLQLFILIVLVGMPIAAMPTNSIRPSVYYSFSFPILLGLFFWSLFMVEQLHVQFFLVAATYSVILVIIARTYHLNLQKTLETRNANQQLLERLRQMAYFDPLTGLANRRWFRETAIKALERGRRHGSRVALLLLDLDNFKQVNDRYGHECGDRLLEEIARRLTRCLRQTDTVVRTDGDLARIGGDELTILLEDIRTAGDVGVVAERILSTLHQPVDLGEARLRPSASLGIALYPDHGEDFKQLMHHADSAMYQAKKAGKNQYAIYGTGEENKVLPEDDQEHLR